MFDKMKKMDSREVLAYIMLPIFITLHVFIDVNESEYGTTERIIYHIVMAGICGTFIPPLIILFFFIKRVASFFQLKKLKDFDVSESMLVSLPFLLIFAGIIACSLIK
jgi:hypothetical protein